MGSSFLAFSHEPVTFRVVGRNLGEARLENIARNVGRMFAGEFTRNAVHADGVELVQFPVTESGFDIPLRTLPLKRSLELSILGIRSWLRTLAHAVDRTHGALPPTSGGGHGGIRP